MCDNCIGEANEFTSLAIEIQYNYLYWKNCFL